jgi:hypothetical protein
MVEGFFVLSLTFVLRVCVAFGAAARRERCLFTSAVISSSLPKEREREKKIRAQPLDDVAFLHVQNSRTRSLFSASSNRKRITKI